MWQRCPKQWEFRYQRGLKLPPKGVMLQGSAYHAALKANFRHKIDSGEDLDIREVMDAYDTSWRERTSSKVEDLLDLDLETDNIDWEGKEPGSLKDEGYKLLSLYHRNVAPSVIPKFVEQREEKPIGREVIYVGYPDIETETEIIDHKLKSKSMNQMDADRDTQPLSYCLLKDKRRFAFHVVVKKKVPEIQIIKVAKTNKDIIWWADAVKQIVAQMKTGIAPPNHTGWWCSDRFCGYWKLCRGRR